MPGRVNGPKAQASAQLPRGEYRLRLSGVPFGLRADTLVGRQRRRWPAGAGRRHAWCHQAGGRAVVGAGRRQPLENLRRRIRGRKGGAELTPAPPSGASRVVVLADLGGGGRAMARHERGRTLAPVVRRVIPDARVGHPATAHRRQAHARLEAWKVGHRTPTRWSRGPPDVLLASRLARRPAAVVDPVRLSRADRVTQVGSAPRACESPVGRGARAHSWRGELPFTRSEARGRTDGRAHRATRRHAGHEELAHVRARIRFTFRGGWKKRKTALCGVSHVQSCIGTLTLPEGHGGGGVRSGIRRAEGLFLSRAAPRWVGPAWGGARRP